MKQPSPIPFAHLVGRSHMIAQSLLISLALVTCQALADINELKLNSSLMDPASDWAFQLDRNNEFWLGYYDANRQLHVRTPEGADQLLGPVERKQAPSGLAMAPLERGVAMMWRDKLPTKGLYLARLGSTQQPPVDLGDATQPLARGEILNLQNRMHALWLGEAGDQQTQEQYHLYYRQQDNSTGELSPIQTLFPGIYPVWCANEAGTIMAFTWTKGPNGHEISARTRLNGQAEFAPPVHVADTPEITPIFQAFRSGNRWFVVWVAQHGEMKNEFQLEGAFSDELGVNWQGFRFDTLRRMDVSSLDILANDSGLILIALSGRYSTDKNDKMDVHLIRSDDRGDHWQIQQPRPLDQRGAYQGANPKLSFGASDKEVILVWEDWRNIRSQLFLNYSQDGGASWRYDNVSLPQPPKTNRMLESSRRSLFYVDGKINIIAEQSFDDSFGAKDLYKISLSVQDIADLAKAQAQVLATPAGTADSGANASGTETGQAATTAPSAPELALRERIRLYWEAMTNSNYETTYAIQDPYFRARNSYDNYRKNMGKIGYRDHVIDRVKIDGPRATTEERITAKIRPFRAKTGELIERPETEITIKNVWLWVDGDWYLEYYNQNDDKRYTRY